MVAKPETKLVKRIKKALDQQRPGWWVKIHGGPYQENGIPDIIGSYKGFHFALEVKYPGKESEVTKHQQYQLDRIKQTGEGKSSVVTSVKEALDFVDNGYREQVARIKKMK